MKGGWGKGQSSTKRSVGGREQYANRGAQNNNLKEDKHDNWRNRPEKKNYQRVDSK